MMLEPIESLMRRRWGQWCRSPSSRCCSRGGVDDIKAPWAIATTEAGSKMQEPLESLLGLRWSQWMLHTWLRILTKVSLASYFDECFFNFIFWRRLHTLTSYFDDGFIFSLKNEGFTPDFVYWWRFFWLHILMKASHFEFVFQWRFHYFFSFSLKNEPFTPDFVFWWRFIWLRIFNEGFTLWLRISMKV
jgi:hypothetical protein